MNHDAAMLRAMRLDDHADYSDESPPFSLARLARTIAEYRGIILIALAAIMAAYFIAATAALLFSERQRLSSVAFRLEFRGADVGQYPNGLRFSVGDITATPVLLDVFAANELSRFVTFDQFRHALFVLESNRELDRLAAEYQSRLADTKLTPVDRERLEREFEAKRSSLSKSDYTIHFVHTSHVDAIPDVVVQKILITTLQIWARRAAIEKKALQYNAPVLGPQVLDSLTPKDESYLIPILLLRNRLNDTSRNIAALREIPGADLIRSTTTRSSLTELGLRADELVRFRLEPLLIHARAAGKLGGSDTALQVLRSQLSYDERALAEAQGREAALRMVLRTYESDKQSQGPADAPSQPGSAVAQRTPDDRETVMPQISEGFLDRIVDMSERNADREYRQQLTEEIKVAALETLPIEATVKYNRELLAFFQSATPPSTSVTKQFEAEWKSMLDDTRQLLVEVNQIYTGASRQLYPETELFRSLGPPVTQVHSSVSRSQIILGGILTLLIGIPAILIGVLLHAKIRQQNDEADEIDNATV